MGINKIIALGHSGFAVDKEIAEKVKGVDVVIGGHTNTFLYSGKTVKMLQYIKTADLSKTERLCIISSADRSFCLFWRSVFLAFED